MGEKQPRERHRCERLPARPLGPGRGFDVAECGAKIDGCESVKTACIEDLPNVTQQLHSNRAIGGLRVSTERNERLSQESPPAASAIASNGSASSCCRSVNSSGSGGRASRKLGMISLDHFSICAFNRAASVPTSRCRNRSTLSSCAARFRRIGIARSATVSGSFPIPAIAFGQNVEKSLKLMLAPCPTQYDAAPPRRCPVLRTPRSASAYSFSPPNAHQFRPTTTMGDLRQSSSSTPQPSLSP